MSTATKRAKVKKHRQNPRDEEIPQEGRGLWIDREFLRRHMNPAPKFVRTDSTDANRGVDRYLELADTLLKTNGEGLQHNHD